MLCRLAQRCLSGSCFFMRQAGSCFLNRLTKMQKKSCPAYPKPLVAVGKPTARSTAGAPP
jgi:hypothetical protein